MQKASRFRKQDMTSLDITDLLIRSNSVPAGHLRWRAFLSFLFLAVFTWLPLYPAQPQEILYPGGYAISSEYSLSANIFAIADTLKITRKVVNNEPFFLSGLYFSENLPPDFEILSSSVRLNDRPVAFMEEGPFGGYIIDNYNCYHWILDDPISESVGNVVNQGDSVTLEVLVRSNDIGNYVLPMHTTVFCGNGTGFFSISEAINVEVRISLDIEDDTESAAEIASTYLLSTAFPNPFNSSVSIKYLGGRLPGKNINLAIYDLLGRSIYHCESESRGDGVLRWYPDVSIASGVYTYRLSAGDISSTGKIMLLK
jgi:hypothetical protein